MSASMTEHISRRLMNPGISQVHRDVPDERYKDLRRPRKVRFFVNGDRFFKGKKLYITPHRYYNFNDLLNDLTGKLPSSLNLPYGVRQIFTPVGGRRVSDIEDLQDGETYVCAGFEGFKVIKYGRTDLEPWSVRKTVRLAHLQENETAADSNYGSYKYRGYAANAFHPGRYYRSNIIAGNATQTTRRWPGTFGNQQRQPVGLLGGPGEALPPKPKVITIIRNGQRPRSHVKILLNRRSIQSFEHLISDISEAFGPKWKNSRVQKLYTLRGREVKGVSDFFREDDCFIAVGNEQLNDSDMSDIIDELFPDSAYARMLMKDYVKRGRKDKKAKNVSKDEGDKKDSGFVDGNNNGDRDTESPSTHRSQRQTHRSKRAAAVAMASERDSVKDSESESVQSYYMLSKSERERKQAALDELDKTRKRQNRLAEQERKALDENLKQRGLPPLNPLKPLGDIPRKDPKEKEEEGKQKEEEARLKVEAEEEEERIRKERELREKAERAARDRMAAAEKAEREKQEREQKEHENADTALKEAKMGVEGEEEGEGNKKAEEDKADESQTDRETEENDTERDSIKGKKEKRRKKDRDNASEKNTGRKAKPKVIRRTKAERQINSDSVVNERYEVGKTLGDGNFAVVRLSRQRSSGQEFAMKVIDKPKLKGKEHMVENEIDILKDCNHPNIVKLYEEYETKDKIYLVMELVKGGDLFDAITQSVKFRERDAAGMVKDLCNALNYLHSRSIVHRDVKPENLLVHRNKDGGITVKLADFGLAMEVTENIYTVCGTPTYVAPEILTEVGYGLEVDMWAVGVITYILLCGFPPFRSPDRNQTELFGFIKAGEYEFLAPYWDNVSESAKNLIRRLLVVDKTKRFSTIDVLSHPWVVSEGDPKLALPGIVNMNTFCKELKRDLEQQAKNNYENYQKLKEKKLKDELQLTDNN